MQLKLKCTKLLLHLVMILGDQITLRAYFQEYQVAVAVAHLPTKPVFVVVHRRRDASSIMCQYHKTLLLAIQKIHIYGNTTQYRRFSEALKWSHGHMVTFVPGSMCQCICVLHSSSSSVGMACEQWWLKQLYVLSKTSSYESRTLSLWSISTLPDADARAIQAVSARRCTTTQPMSLF